MVVGSYDLRLKRLKIGKVARAGKFSNYKALNKVNLFFLSWSIEGWLWRTPSKSYGATSSTPRAISIVLLLPHS